MSLDWSSGGGAGSADWSGGGASQQLGSNLTANRSNGTGFNWNPFHDVARAVSNAYHYTNPIQGVERAAMGIGKMFVDPIYNTAEAGGNLLAAGVEAARGRSAAAGQDLHTAASFGTNAAQDVTGDVAGMGMMFANLGSTIATPLGLGGQYDKAVGGAFRWVAQEANAKMPGVPNAFSPQMAAAMENYRPQTVLAEARHGGLTGAVIDQAMPVMMIGGAVEPVAEGAATTASAAASTAADAGDAAGAAAAEARAARMGTVADVASNAAHLPKFLGIKATQLLQAFHDQAYPGYVPDATATPEGTTAPVADEVTPQPHPEPANATAEEVAAVRATLAPEAAAAETIGQGAADYARMARESGVLADAQPVSPADAYARAAREADVLKVPEKPGNTPSSVDEVKASIQQTVQEARDGTTPTYVEDQFNQRMAMPAPAWAQRIASFLPDSVNRVLANFNGPITRTRLTAVARDMSRYIEIAQNQARSDPAARAMQDAAAQIISENHSLKSDVVSHMVGEEVNAQLNGTALLTEFVRRTGQVASPEQMAKLIDISRGGKAGIPQDVMDSLPEEAQARLKETIQQAVDLQRGKAGERLQTLLSSRYGARGLERALLDPQDMPMTPEQTRLYNRAMSDFRRAAELRQLEPKEIARNQANLDSAVLGATKAADEVAKLQQQYGITEATITSLHDGVPPGITNADAVAAAMVDATLKDQGATIDPGRGVPKDPGLGIHVGISNQFDVPLAEFQARGAQLIAEAIRFPKDTMGGNYDAAALWSGPDAHFGTFVHAGPDGTPMVAGDIGISTHAGEPLSALQAQFLGEAYKQDSLWDPNANNGAGGMIFLSNDPTVQTLYSRYAGDILDPKSSISKVAADMQRVVDDGGLQITTQEVSAELLNLMHWDQAFREVNPAEYKDGHIFDYMAHDLGAAKPTRDFMPQTVLDMTTDDIVQRALNEMDQAKVSRALAWYYDSHDFIEGLYRGKQWVMPDAATGTPRDAADVFYDVLAVTSVMASPKQNFGRALMGFANFDDMIRAHDNGMAAAKAIMDRAFTENAAGTSRVVDLGKPTEKVMGLDAKEGTAVADRWLNTPEFRKLTEGTAMTTVPKYNVIDILMGRLNLQTATNEQIVQQYADWTGKGRSGSDANLPRQNVLDTADARGLSGHGVQAYRDWVGRLNDLIDTRQQIKDLKATGFGTKEAIARVLEMHGAHDLVRLSDFRGADGAMAEGAVERSPEVTPEEFRALADKGRAQLAQYERDGGPPTGLDNNWEKIVAQAYDATSEPWGGATFDAHTGKPIEGTPDQLAVTTKAPGKATIEVSPQATEAEFGQAMDLARQRFAHELSMDKAHLGVFYDEAKGTIDIDPVTVVDTVDEANALGAASRSLGGAYRFSDGNGYYTPHVAEDAVSGGFKTQAQLEQAWRMAKGEESHLLDDPEVRQAFETALMEYQGSSLLAKLRSFADNLRDPHNSLAVTLDSIMAAGYGMDKTDFGKSGVYGDKANEVRTTASGLSEKWGRDVRPHEVQALAWVAIKTIIGRQDWGRLLAHRDIALSNIDAIESAVNAGGKVDPRTFDPLGDWWNEELGQSVEDASIRAERAELKRNSKRSDFTPEDQARLDELNAHVPKRTSEIWTTPDRGGAEGYGDAQRYVEERTSIPYDAKVLKMKMDSFGEYRTALDQWRKDIVEGNIDKVRRELIAYVQGWQRPIMGDSEGGSFAVVGPETANEPGQSANTAIERLQGARYVPPPNAEMLHASVDEMNQMIQGKLRGATLVQPDAAGKYLVRLFENADLGTLLHEHAHLLRQILPGDKMAELSTIYPHLQDATFTPERAAAEERFVTDLTSYIRNTVRGTGAVPPGLDALFGRVADLLEQTYPDFLKTQAGQALPNDIVSFWDRMYHPNIVEPDALHDPLSAQYVEPPKGVNVRQFRWESDAQFAQRARQYGEARSQAVTTARDLAQAQARAAKADDFVRKMTDIINGPTKTSELANKLAARATSTLARIDAQLDHPTMSQVPPAWRPLMGALGELSDMAKADTTGALAEALGEVPETFSQALAFAAERGFDPVHVPDMTWQQAQRWVFGHLSLITDETMSGLRKENTGVLTRSNMADRSMEALQAGNVSATAELYRGRIVDLVERQYADTLPRGEKLPKGWQPWAAQKQAVILGRLPDVEGGLQPGQVATGDIQIVPDQVVKALDGMRKSYTAWPFRMLMKTTNFWKQLILTYSPAWYEKHFIGATSLAVAEGARWGDFMKAIHQFKTDTMPDAVKGRSIYSTIDDGEKAHTLVERNLSDILHNEGVRAAKDNVNNTLRSVVKTWDGIARAAVIAAKLREGGSPEYAVTRAYEALGDFGNMSPVERDIVQALMPFYSFQKAMFKLLMRMPADHPMATGILMQLGRIQENRVKANFGAIPTQLVGTGIVNGKLVAYQKLNPLTDAWTLMTPEGIAQGMNPFLQMVAQRAFDAPVFNAGVGMGSYGQTVETGNLIQQLQDLYVSSPVGTALPGGSAFNLARFLGQPKVYTPTQIIALKKRIAKTLKNEQTAANGGYPVLDVNAAKQTG